MKPYDHLFTSTIFNYLKIHRIKFDKENVSFFLSSIHLRKSITSIALLLRQFGFQSLSINIEFDNIKKIPTPAICVIKKDIEPTYAILNEIRDDSILIDNIEYSYGEAELMWTESVVIGKHVISKSLDDIKPTLYNHHYFYSALLVFLLILNYLKGVSFLFTLPQIFGVVISYMIYLKYTSNSNEVLNNVCKSDSDDTNSCLNAFNYLKNNIPFGKLLPVVIMSYYLTSILFNGIVDYSGIWFYLSSVGIPLVIYLSYLHVKEVKGYCVLCLATIANYFFELIINYCFLNDTAVRLEEIGIGIICIIISFIWAYSFYNIFLNFSKNKIAARSLLEIKTNKKLFSSAQSLKPEIVIPDSIDPIVFHKGSSRSIKAIIKLDCKHCIDLLNVVEKLVQVCVDTKFEFYIFCDDRTNEELVNSIISASREGDFSFFRKAVINNEIIAHSTSVEQYYKSFVAADLNNVIYDFPTILLDNKRLDYIYSSEDLFLLLD